MSTTYDGPIASPPLAESWPKHVWIEDGIQIIAQRFGPPPNLTVRRIVPPARAWIGRVDRAIESFRIEALGLDMFDPLLDELEEDYEGESLDEVPTMVASEAKRDGTLRIQVLGPVDVTGWASPPDRAVVTELACFLALHRGRTVTGDEVRAALWPDPEKEPSAKTLRSYLSLLRRAVGSNNLPSAGGRGYRIGPLVTTDWDEFQELAAHSELKPKLRALDLVRGKPFAGVASNTYAWVFAELWVSDMEIQIGRLAFEAAVQCLDEGDHQTALRALRQGLLGTPSDPALWKSYLAVAGGIGTGALARAEAEARAALGPDAADLL